MTLPWRSRFVGSCGLGIVLAFAFALTGGACGSDANSEDEPQATTAKLEKADLYKSLVDRGGEGPPGSLHRETQPAKILKNPDSPAIGPALLWPVINGWVAGNHRRITYVYAGGPGDADPDNPGGRFGIFRQNFLQLTQRTKLIDVPKAGPLKITRAPEGRGRVQTRAQRRGKIHFKSRNGVRGILRLKDNTIRLKP
jgi:hypothetical protein